MQPFRPQNLAITVEKAGSHTYTKTSHPTRFGKYAEIKTRDYEFHFNLDGRIKFIRGLGSNWPHPFETLKRTDGNDWVYYTVGAVIKQRGIRDWLGEYYLPCFAYQSNSITNFTPYAHPEVPGALAALAQLYANIRTTRPEHFLERTRAFLDLVAANDDTALFAHAQKLHTIIGGRVSVLPPDTRHVDYEVIPLTIADGCLYHCRFCIVQSNQKYRPRPLENIRAQIRDLKTLYGRNLPNYNSLFLGQHDALAAGPERICTAAAEAFAVFGFADAHIHQPRLFMFGSVDSLLRAGDALFASLDRLPFKTHINIGLESVDADTLAALGKPLEVTGIRSAFDKMLSINRSCDNIEITANFLIGDPLSPDHHQALADLLANVAPVPPGKGAVYISPYAGQQDGAALLETFYAIKNTSRLPVYIYLIQRL
ncbi:MAG: radical SAM protein [Desulfobacterales bacterium]|nr:radical SAM protein [Desulfobacterales bacterium]